MGLVSRLLVVIVALLTFAIAIFTSRSASAATVAIEGGNNYFCSSAFDGGVCETNVAAGDTVTWTIVGGTHTITQCSEDFSACPPTGGWDSGIISKDDTFSQMFASPGTHAYRCELHPSEMRGKVVVAALTPSPTPTLTSEPTSAPVSGSTTATPAALPQTGGNPGGGAGVKLYVSLGLALLAGALLAFTFARRRV